MADTDTETTNSSSRRSSLLKANNNNNNGSSLNNNNSTNNNNNNISNSSAESGGLATVEIKTEAASPIFRCEQCNKFETHAHSLLLVHIINCEAKRNGNAVLDGGSTSTPSPATNDSTTKKHPLQPQPANGTMTSTSPADTESVGGGGAAGTSTSSGGGSSSCTNENTENNDDRKTQQQQGQQQPQHSLRKLFECDVCNMKFSNGANMRRHKMRHTGVKPYECRVCQKRFFRKDHLAEHFTTHTKTLPFHCPVCNRGFQRQIAMRAHFQNEHVGQHDLVKTCPMCSYRAGTMKSLRVHFFNRHGIDLDNPGARSPPSLLLALSTNSKTPFLPSSVAAAAAAAAAAASSTAATVTYSDSGESFRSVDNTTPPLNLLTPQVEILTTDTEKSLKAMSCNDELQISPVEPKESNIPTDYSPNSPYGDGNSSSNHLNEKIPIDDKNSITPLISLIPIEDENCGDESDNKMDIGNSVTGNSSIIQISPLKSLLREDLKRRICSRTNSRFARNAGTPNGSNNSKTNLSSSSSASTPSHQMMTTEEMTEAAAKCLSTFKAVLSSAASAAASSTSPATTQSSLSTSLANCSSLNNNSNNTNNNSNNNDKSATSPATSYATIQHKKILPCYFCGIEFPDQTLYFLHKGCHSESNPWKCNICGEQCSNVYEFNSHLLSRSHQ